MDDYTDTSINRLVIVERGGRRRFSHEVKLRIVEESYSGSAPGLGDGPQVRDHTRTAERLA